MPFNELPAESNQVRFGEIADLITSGATPTVGKTELYSNETNGIPFFRIQNIAVNRLLLTDLKYITEEVHKSDLRRSQLKPGDVLVTITGRLGTAAVVPPEIERANINQHICLIRLKKNVADPYYISFHLNSEETHREIMSKQHGTTRIALNHRTVSSLRINLPPMEIQKKIAGTLEQANRLIHTREQGSQLTNKIIQSVFQKMFGDPASNPQDWSTQPLKSGLVDLIYRYPTFYNIEYLDHGIPVLKVENITKDGYLEADLDSVKCISEETNKRFPKTVLKEDDLVMAVRGATIGKIAVVSKRFEGSNINPNLIRISTNRERLNPVYLWAYLNLPFGRAQFGLKVTNTAKATVTVPSILSIKIPLPPISFQDRFCIAAKKLWTIRERQHHSSQEINELFHSIMQNAFRG